MVSSISCRGVSTLLISKSRQPERFAHETLEDRLGCPRLCFRRQAGAVRSKLALRFAPRRGQGVGVELPCCDVNEIAMVESAPRQDGRNMTMVLNPIRKAKAATTGKPVPTA